MTTNRLDEIAARAKAATEGPWSARTTGRSGGDHWCICDDGEAIAHISAQDGINEDQREPDAEFIAHAREDVPALVAALRAVEAVHKPTEPTYPGERLDCAGCLEDCHYCEGDHPWPCPTITAIREAMGQ